MTAHLGGSRGTDYQAPVARMDGRVDAYLMDLYARRIIERPQAGPAFSVQQPSEAKVPGTVTREDDFVTIGGVKVPRKS